MRMVAIMAFRPRTVRVSAAITHPSSAVENDAVNVVRVLAAVAVVISHVRTLLIVDYDDAPHDLVQHLLFGTTALGKQAVVVFFVLSGFWVGGSVLRRSAQQRFRWSDYAVDRVVRLSLVLVPALVLTALLDAVGKGMFPTSSVYVGSDLYAGVVAAQPPSDSWGLWIANALFLVGVATPSFGSNAALWSVGYEFWMYAVGAVVVVAAVRRRRLEIGLAVTALVCCAVLNPDLLLYLVVWLLGAGVAALHPLWSRLTLLVPRLLVPARVLAATTTIGAALLVRGLNDLPLWSATALVAVPAAALLATLASWPTSAARRGFSGLASRLSASSYSLYAIHVPVAVFLTAALGVQASGRWSADALHWFLVLAGTVLLVAAGWAFSLVTERRTASVRAVVRHAIGRLARREDRSGAGSVLRS